MRSIRIIFLLVFVILSSNIAFAEGVEMADVMRSNGKIYVVVGVILIIFAGLLFYLIQTGRKADGIEKRIKELEE